MSSLPLVDSFMTCFNSISFGDDTSLSCSSQLSLGLIIVVMEVMIGCTWSTAHSSVDLQFLGVDNSASILVTFCPITWRLSEYVSDVVHESYTLHVKVFSERSSITVSSSHS